MKKLICIGLGLGLFTTTTFGAMKKVIVLQTTDLHHRVSGVGAFNSFSANDSIDNSKKTTGKDITTGGYARLATMITKVRKEAKALDIPVLLIDSGDFLMGTVYDMTIDNPASFQFFQKMKYDAVTLGNHEFDYGPQGLSLFIGNAKKMAMGFNVPIIASNMVTDGVAGTSDDYIEAWQKDQSIVSYKVIDLPNGLKVGLIGLVGKNADDVAPAAKPITFNHDTVFIQKQVDHLRNVEGADIVIALSHSGVNNPNSATPSGDDIELAKRIKGLDFIASGHDHQMTKKMITVGKTNIFCSGFYGQNLSRIDILYDDSSKSIKTDTLINYAIDDSIPGDKEFNKLVTKMNTSLDSKLTKSGNGLKLGKIVTSSKFLLTDPKSAKESMMGNLIADANRSVIAKRFPYSLGVVPNGVIRGSLMAGATSFANLFSILPLGMTNASDQKVMAPGYPLLTMFMSAADIKKMLWVGLNIPAVKGSSYFLNISGIKYEYGLKVAGIPKYGVEVKKVSLVTNPITGATSGDFENDGPYPVVVNLYMLLMMSGLDSELIAMGMPPLNVNLMTPSGGSVNMTDRKHKDHYLNFRIDADQNPTNGIQEVKEWMAFLNYTSTLKQIPGDYNKSGTANALGRAVFK